jgi:hypothetical protein
MNSDPDPDAISIRAYSHKELASLYSISWITLQKWLEPYEQFLGEKVGHFYNAKQVKMIFEFLGRPERQR